MEVVWAGSRLPKKTQPLGVSLVLQAKIRNTVQVLPWLKVGAKHRVRTLEGSRNHKGDLG